MQTWGVQVRFRQARQYRQHEKLQTKIGDILRRQPYLGMPAVLALRSTTAIAILTGFSLFVSPIMFPFSDGGFY